MFLPVMYVSALSVIRPFDPWRSPLCTCPRKYTLNPYTGCSHMCLYCYATSYIGKRESTPKRDLIVRVVRDLKQILRFETEPLINMSTSSDPYPPEETIHKLTRRVLEILCKHPVRLLITTKSSLVVRDLDLLRKARCAVAITVTTLDESLAKKLEPNAPSPRERLRAIERLSREDVPVAVRIDPVIPFVNDDPAELRRLVQEVVSSGAVHVVTSTYKARPDNFRRLLDAFPELERKLRRLYYEEGEKVHGYRYLRPDLRKKLLAPIIECCRTVGVSYAVCREGIPEYRRAPSCDGSHLVRSRA